jgi:hypothetical protein
LTLLTGRWNLTLASVTLLRGRQTAWLHGVLIFCIFRSLPFLLSSASQLTPEVCLQLRTESNHEGLGVDDDETVRSLVARTLASGGSFVTTAENGCRALDEFEADPSFQMIATDLNMPGRVDGLALAEKTWSTSGTGRSCIFGRVGAPRIREYVTRGRAYFPSKPFTLTALQP